jgi:hypothetical protein
MLREVLILLAMAALFVFVMSPKAWSEPYDYLRTYAHPIVCKPITVVDDIVILADEKDWVVLEWKHFVAIAKDKLLFRYMEEIVAVPMTGYICQQ